MSLLGALVSGAGAVWVFVQENQFVGMSAVVVFIGIVISIVGAFLSSDERTRFEHDLRKSSDEIARLNREIMHSVTGGDSWCWILLRYAEIAPGKGGLTLYHEGEYPLHDLTITMIDWTKTDRAIAEGGELDDLPVRATIWRGNLRPNRIGREFALWNLPTTDAQDYIFDFEARNGVWRQFYKLRRVDGRWAVATRVFRVLTKNGSDVLKEVVDRDFPRDEQGNVNWG
ncbi:MAG: hypothetical protein M3Q29_14730 [Chloroflexota bacterium]|nr:hypothetical protein [Chloroflexota bacterium]